MEKRHLDNIEIAKKMRSDKIYYHCICCGGIFEDRQMEEGLATILGWYNGRPLPREFNTYQITSGACKGCFEDKRNNSHSSLLNKNAR